MNNHLFTNHISINYQSYTFFSLLQSQIFFFETFSPLFYHFMYLVNFYVNSITPELVHLYYLIFECFIYFVNEEEVEIIDEMKQRNLKQEKVLSRIRMFNASPSGVQTILLWLRVYPGQIVVSLDLAVK